MFFRRLMLAAAVTAGLFCPGVVTAEGGSGDWRFRVESGEDGAAGRSAYTAALGYPGGGAKPHIEIGHTGNDHSIGFMVTGTHDTKQEKCEYRDWKVSIDGTDIPVLGYTFAPAKTELKTKLGTSTGEAWDLFRKGLRLTVRAEQKCDSDFGKARQMSLVFSLRGSNAAYRYVGADFEK